MQKIETAIGEADAQALAAPFGETLAEHRAVEHDLVLGSGRGGRQQAMAQFVDAYRRGARLADHHGSARIGSAHRGFIIRTKRQHDRQHRHHRVAGPGDVAHFHRIGGHMHRRLAIHAQRHALLAARHQHGFACDHAGKFLCRRRDRRVADRFAPCRIGQLAPVRRDQRRAAIDRIVLSFGIDDDAPAEPPRLLDHRADDARGEHALGVVGEHHDGDARKRRERTRDQLALAVGVRGRGLFPVGAQQVR